MTEIPRKPSFPSYMVQKLLIKIQSDVDENVIPVSTGIFSYEKLKNKLEAIPKPEEIFFQIIHDKLRGIDKTGEKCPSCEEQYHIKKNPVVMCDFCGYYCCKNCMPLRKRSHPLSKDGSGQRYNACQRCDKKYLNLQLGHSYVEKKTLIEQAIAKTSEELSNARSTCEEYKQILSKSKQTFQKNKYKMSQLRKEKLQLTKEIKSKLPEQIKSANQRNQQLKQSFVTVHLRHKEFLIRSDAKNKQKHQSKKIEEQKAKAFEQQQNQLKNAERMKVLKQEEQKQKNNQNFNDKFKKTLALSQNSTFNINVAYSTGNEFQKKSSQPVENINNQETQTLEQSGLIKQTDLEIGVRDSIEEKSQNYQFIQQHHQKIDSSDDFRSDQHKSNSNNQQTNLIQKSQLFATFFTQQLNNQRLIPIEQICKSQYIIEKQLNQSKNLQEQKFDYINNFTFNDKSLQHLQPQHTTWYSKNEIERLYQEEQKLKQAKKFNQIKEKSYTFHGNDEFSEQNEEQKKEFMTKPTQQQLSREDDNQQDNRISFIDQWYINKKQSNQIQQQQSTLSNVLQSKKATPNELEEQCTKSNSELDEQEIEAARYSLIKAARETAMQERQRNKVYQKSMHDVAPFSEETEGVGEVQKCQCSIY